MATATPSYAPTNVSVGLLTGSEREVYVTWDFNHSHVKEFKVHWEYYTGTTYRTTNKAGKVVTQTGNAWFVGNDASTSGTSNRVISGRRTYAETWTAPNNATKVRVKITPYSTTYTKKVKKKDKTYKYWNGKASTVKTLNFNSVISKVTVTGAPTNVKLAQQGTSGRTLIATWTFSGSGVTGYEVEWQYKTTSYYLNGSTATVTTHAATYDIPEGAKTVAFRVRINTESGTGPWTAWTYYEAGSLHPSEPSTPTVTLNQYTLTASIDNYESSIATGIQFQIVQDNSKVLSSPIGNLSYGRASVAIAITSGHTYKVRCRAVNGTNISEWSDYSDIVYSLPAPPGNFTSCVALSESQVELKWPINNYADSYTIEYTTKKIYFDTSSNNVQSISELKTGTAIIDVDTGNTWFFRCKAIKDGLESGWNAIESITVGKKPAEPTTWSLTSTAGVGDIVKMYWVHNSQDNSSQVAAELELSINGFTSSILIANKRNDDEKDNVSEYEYNTSSLTEGAIIQWRVRTRGALPTFSDWSIVREIKVYAKPVVYLETAETHQWIWDTFNFEEDLTTTTPAIPIEYPEIVTTLPIFICARAEPAQQTPTRFTLTVTALEDYEISGEDGRIQRVKENEDIFTRVYYPMSQESFKNHLITALSPAVITLENNINYRLTCMVVMDSGLTDSATYEFSTGWDDLELIPNAEISVDEETYTASITPYCEGVNEERVDNVLLSVYRRNYDGTLTEIAKNLYGFNNTTVTDPHPALDYARYRVIVKDIDTGKITYDDLVGEELEETAIIIQWDEDWHEFDSLEEDAYMDEPEWSGSLLRLPYNVDVTDNHAPDVEFVEYIGRKYPVSYYGTQQGETATWNTAIDKEDVETLYALRRLAIYMGDCYVREPSGSGYWANVGVTITQTHRETSIPITLTLTRVEGGA